MAISPPSLTPVYCITYPIFTARGVWISSPTKLLATKIKPAEFNLGASQVLFCGVESASARTLQDF